MVAWNGFLPRLGLDQRSILQQLSSVLVIKIPLIGRD